jgi:FkbM family methyltransferase
MVAQGANLMATVVARKKIPLVMWLKSSLVAGRLEPAAQAIRSISKVYWRLQRPELTEFYLEQQSLPKIVSSIVRRDSSVVDVGCHIGSFLSLAVRYAPEGKHIAFEASPTKAAMLTRKFERVEIVNKAVSDHNGRARFVEDATLSGTSYVGDSGTIEVAACTLDDALTGRRIDLLKLDIEGHEFRAFKGAQRIMSEQRPPIIFECGPTADTPHRREMFDLMTSHGYGVMCFADFLHNRGPIQYDEFHRCGIYPFRAMNFIALPS